MKSTVKWAMFLAIAMIIWLVLEWMAGIHSFLVAYYPISTWIYYLIVALGIAFHTREVNRDVLQKKGAFIHLLAYNLLLLSVLIPVQSLIIWLYASVINPGLLSNLAEYNTLYHPEMAPEDMLPEQFYSQYFAPGNFVLMFAMPMALLGIFLSFLAAAFTRTGASRYSD